MNRLKRIWRDSHGCLRPDTGAWCPGCELPLWGDDGVHYVCPDCVEFYIQHNYDPITERPLQTRREM